MAIQKVLARIPKSCSIPILLIQHMPQNFTKSFAERLNDLCNIRVKQAEQGDILQPGLALLGPGGMQMELKNQYGKQIVSLRPKALGEIYSPCADITFSSVARQASGQVLAVVLTGMGSDGQQGASLLKQRGAEIWAQDEASSTIYGMPKAIADAQLANHIYSLDEIAQQFDKLS
nr:CheB methylesterase domain-containing protein [Methylomarinum sp. Ch1-1]MDP4519376.1 CheB methylesterase domain-containing protein [Methylomarinum sp. Ch1-1]